MTLEERLKELLGDLVFSNANLDVQLEQAKTELDMLKAKVKELEEQKGES